jgi:hypothetical protein
MERAHALHVLPVGFAVAQGPDALDGDGQQAQGQVGRVPREVLR